MEEYKILSPNIYKKSTSGLVTTWDVRIKHTGESMTPEVLHTLEHTMTDYLRKRYGSYRILGVSPMGCQTGMKVLTRFIDRHMIHESIVDYIMHLQRVISISRDSIVDCDKPRFHDLKEAKYEMMKYYDETLRFHCSAIKY